MSLRARLLTVVVSLTAIGLVVASIVTYQQLRSFLVDRVDRTATASAEAITQSLEHGRGPGPGLGAIDAIASANPGLYVGAVANGNVQWAGSRTRPGEKALMAIAESWRPWRGVASRLFWAYYRTIKGRDAVPTP